jgi:hypothetical protein
MIGMLYQLNYASKNFILRTVNLSDMIGMLYQLNYASIKFL